MLNILAVMGNSAMETKKVRLNVIPNRDVENIKIFVKNQNITPMVGQDIY